MHFLIIFYIIINMDALLRHPQQFAIPSQVDRGEEGWIYFRETVGVDFE